VFGARKSFAFVHFYNQLVDRGGAFGQAIHIKLLHV
jgi:hypothetical protein